MKNKKTRMKVIKGDNGNKQEVVQPEKNLIDTIECQIICNDQADEIAVRETND